MGEERIDQNERSRGGRDEEERRLIDVGNDEESEVVCDERCVCANSSKARRGIPKKRKEPKY